MRDVMVMVAPNGARRGKADHPALPVTAAELGADAAACFAAGAAAIHLHVRDAIAGHSLDRAIYRAAIAAVRRYAAPHRHPDHDRGGRALHPGRADGDACAPSGPRRCRSRSANLSPTPASEPEARASSRWMAESHVAPQFILYTPEEVTRCLDLIDRGVIPLRAALPALRPRPLLRRPAVVARRPRPVRRRPRRPRFSLGDVRLRPARGRMRPRRSPRSAATSASASRTTSISPTAPSHRTTPRWSKPPSIFSARRISALWMRLAPVR